MFCIQQTTLSFSPLFWLRSQIGILSPPTLKHTNMKLIYILYPTDAGMRNSESIDTCKYCYFFKLFFLCIRTIDWPYVQGIEVIDSLTMASDHMAKLRSNSHYRPIPGWNDYVKEAHLEARDAFLLWQTNSKARFGPIYENMKTTRARFKHCLRHCKSIETKARADAIAKKYLDKDTSSFWKEIRKIKKTKEITLKQHQLKMWMGMKTSVIFGKITTKSFLIVETALLMNHTWQSICKIIPRCKIFSSHIRIYKVLFPN